MSSSSLERPPESIFPHSEEDDEVPFRVSVDEYKTQRLQEYSPE